MKEQTLFYRRLFGRFVTGVAVVLAEEGGEIRGLTVNSLTSASLDPLLLLFCVRNDSHSGAAILRVGRFTVNVLGADQENLARHFAGRKDTNLEFEYSHEEGFVWLNHCNAVFRCELEVSYPGGDHRIVLGRVKNMLGPDECERLLVYHEGHYGHLRSKAAGDSQMEERHS
ncbi:MAG: flavin reductase family protein [Terriglobales bacterium]